MSLKLLTIYRCIVLYNIVVTIVKCTEDGYITDVSEEIEGPRGFDELFGKLYRTISVRKQPLRQFPRVKKPPKHVWDNEAYHRWHDKPYEKSIYEVKIDYFEFVASIHLFGKFRCGGSIIESDLILTSAACLQILWNNRFSKENVNQLAVRVGSSYSDRGGELIDALEIYFHPNYIPHTLHYDLAIIRLLRHLHFKETIPKRIEVYGDSGRMPTDSEVVMVGWGGIHDYKNDSERQLYMKILPVMPTEECREIFPDWPINNRMFCTGSALSGPTACNKDMGAPAFLGRYQVGIVSFGPSVCGQKESATVFTLVGSFLDWIHTVNSSMPNYYRSTMEDEDEITNETTQAINEKNDAATEKNDAATEKNDAANEKNDAATEKKDAANEKNDAATEKNDAATEKVDSLTKKEEAPPNKNEAPNEETATQQFAVTIPPLAP